MSSTAPVAIGTRGTVGSLVRREIEYFKRLDLEYSSSTGSKRHQETRNPRILVDAKTASQSKDASSSSSNNSSGNFLTMSWKKKNKRKSNNGGRRFLPSMCSAVDVSEGSRFDGIPGFNYRNLKSEMELCK